MLDNRWFAVLFRPAEPFDSIPGLSNNSFDPHRLHIILKGMELWLVFMN